MFKSRVISFYLILLLIFSGSKTYSQNTGILRGFVSDSLNGEALVNATIRIEETNQGASADSKGYFSIPAIKANSELTLQASFVGYATQRIHFRIEPGKILQLSIELKPIYIQLEGIEAVARRRKDKETDLGLARISIKEMEMLPKGVESDVMRSLQFVPGVKMSGDVSAHYYVRGGSSDQNLVLLNGVPVYNPFHAMGMFSVLDPEMINYMEFYKGGFTAEYGGRLSSVLNLITKDGNKNRLAGNANISFLTGKASIEGPLPSGSFIITGRKSLFNGVLQKFFNYQDAPFEFYDLSFKANFSNMEEMSHTKVSMFGFISNDLLNNKDVKKENMQWTNNIFGVNWFQVWESPLYSDISFSLSNFKQQNERKQSSAAAKYNKVEDITLKMDFTYLLDSRDEIKFGYYIKSFRSDLNYQSMNGVETNISDFGANISIYSKYRLLRFDKFIADVGTRLNAAPLAKKSTTIFEPRVSFTYKVMPIMALKGAWGIYTQDIVTVTDENDIISLFEPWVIMPEYLTASTAIHYDIGLETYLTDYLSLNIEGYYKLMQNLTDLNKYKMNAADPDLMNGRGESYGWEAQLLFQQSKLKASLGYSLSWAYKEVDNWLYYPRYDARHSFNFNLTFDIGNNWQVGAVWLFSSGMPFTQIEGYYDKLYLNDLYAHLYVLGQTNPFTILASRNLGRLPVYHRMDLSLAKKLRFNFLDFSLSLNVVNVYDRKNIFYFERDTGKRVNMLPFMPTASMRIDL